MASTLLGLCVGQLQPQLLVFSRLDSSCVPLTGPNDQTRNRCFASWDANPQYDDGQEFGRKSAGGVRCWYVRDCDHLKQYDLTGQLTTWDLELMEMALGATLKVGKGTSGWVGTSAGLEMPGIDADCPDGVSVEIYTKAAIGAGGFCAPATGGNPPSYIRHLFPFTQLKMGQVTFDDNGDGVLLNISGFGLANPSWGDGPNNDWNLEGDVGASTPYTFAFADLLPTHHCGYVDPNSPTS